MRDCHGCTPLPARYGLVPPIAPDGVQHPLLEAPAPRRRSGGPAASRTRPSARLTWRRLAALTRVIG
jgi:hypothetical protein